MSTSIQSVRTPVTPHPAASEPVVRWRWAPFVWGAALSLCVAFWVGVVSLLVAIF